MQDADQLNAILDWAIKDEITTERKASEIDAHFFDTAAHFWCGCNDTQCCVELSDYPVSGCNVVQREVTPDFVIVSARLPGPEGCAASPAKWGSAGLRDAYALPAKHLQR